MFSLLKNKAGRVGIGLALVLVGLWAFPGLRILPYGCALALVPAAGHLPVPVAGVRPRELVDSFGAPRSGGRHHAGTDIFGARGTSVQANTEGVVAYVGTNALGGQVVWVLAPGARWHYYAHLDAFGPIHAGQWISQGDVLGSVGSTGNARGTPPHLHYGIYRWWGRAINPYPVLHDSGRHA